MMIFEYLTFLCDQDQLQDRLTKAGAEGWRLHTCEPVVNVGPYGSGEVRVLVVLDKAILPEEADDAPVADGPPEGIAMRG